MGLQALEVDRVPYIEVLDEDHGAVAERAFLVVEHRESGFISSDQRAETLPPAKGHQQQVMNQHGKAKGIDIQREDDADMETGPQQQQGYPEGPKPEQEDEHQLKQDDGISDALFQPADVKQRA